MGYSTDFEGELLFTRPLIGPELATVQKLFWMTKDEADHQSLKMSHGDISYVQFEFTKNLDGIKWDGSEKFYQAVEAVNFIIENARVTIPDFGLKGTLKAQGEEVDDRWLLQIGESGWAVSEKIVMKGRKVNCPECGTDFMLEEAE